MPKLFLIFLFVCVFSQAFASPAACTAPEYKRFNFWLGDWDTYEANGKGSSEARNQVSSILGGCVILERYMGNDGLAGESFTIYDSSRHVWHQTWVTNRGHLLELEGNFKGYDLSLQGTEIGKDGKPILIRGIWRPLLNGVRETAYESRDGGKTWSVDFDILFKSHH
jgi:hypothetical protein